ncbi:superoxide dismutase [Texcoconibacillus texcoconensis]|uniref:superoxide dismutase n=1 Tax=Texcoconibacillus texcoconensis TaxID=1095777 RepID=A0A840QNL0_9BACI|nr:superoxide dismutase [Texcoconibacillus texcoconensis]MBB5172965.1 Fe-Mn family superoxide dismutase [Texcoconibacillus texcoconensis]
MDNQELTQYASNLKGWLKQCRDIIVAHRWEEGDRDYHRSCRKIIDEIDEIDLSLSELDSENVSEEQISLIQEKATSLYERMQQQTGNEVEGEEERAEGTERVKVGQHKLPPLDYDYDALEPYINKRIMELHHQKHHQSYVDGLNKAEKKLAEARRKKDDSLIKHWERELAFHGAGHYLHSIFWKVMNPEGGGNPQGSLAQQIDDDFGNYRSFRWQFTEAAKQVEGVGWAILVWAPRSRRLEILTAEKHQNLSQWDVIPLLPIDVWEHAYYLQYENNRERYIDCWWNVVHWPAVQERFDVAKNVKWEPF